MMYPNTSGELTNSSINWWVFISICFDTSNSSSRLRSGNRLILRKKSSIRSSLPFGSDSPDSSSILNFLINSSYQIAQRGTSSTSTGFQTVDRWSFAYGGTDEAPTQAQHTLSSSDDPYSEGFRYSFHITNGNQSSGAGATDYIAILTSLEAQDLANSGWNYTSALSDITISFWAKSSVAKTFCVQLYTADGTPQAYNHHYALSANTWKKVIHTFPGYANVQFDNDANKAIEIQWNMFSGTTYTEGSTVDQWVTYNGNTSTPDENTDWYTTNDATFEITGVQLEVGSQATAFEHRSYGEELAHCQRYFEKTSMFLSTNEVALSQIGQRAGIDSRTMQRLQQGYPTQFDSVINAIWQKEPKNTMIRTFMDSNTHGIARAVLSDKFNTLFL